MTAMTGDTTTTTTTTTSAGGTTDSTTLPDASRAFMETLERDDAFQPFLCDTFDATDYANNIIRGLTLSASLEKLSVGITLLDRELRNQVVARHEELLEQATGVHGLESTMHGVCMRVESLTSATERIRGLISEPYQQIRARTTQLTHLQGACDILRRVIRYLYLTKRLRSQLQGGTRELAKSAQTLSDLDVLSREVDLSGVAVVDAEVSWVATALQRVESDAKRMLVQGTESQNQAEVATGLQVFHNLGQLNERVQGLIESLHGHYEAGLQSALNMDSLRKEAQATVLAQASQQQRGGVVSSDTPPIGGTAAWRATLWLRLETFADFAATLCQRAYHIQKVLSKKKDPVTHVPLIDHIVLPSEMSIVSAFWARMCRTLGDSLSSSSKGSNFLLLTLEGEYPKLLALCLELWQKVGTLFTSSASGSLTSALIADSNGSSGEGSWHATSCNHDIVNGEKNGLVSKRESFMSNELVPPELILLRQSITPFQTAYLAQSLSHLFDPINLVFSTTMSPVGAAASPPSADDVVNITKTFSNELQVAAMDNDLAASVAHSIAKAIRLFAFKTEQMVATSSDAFSICSSPSPSFLRNATLVDRLAQLHSAVVSIVSGLVDDLPTPAVRALDVALKDTQALMSEHVIEPLFFSLSASLESIIVLMHKEDFNSAHASRDSDETPDAPCSPYIRALTDRVLLVQDLLSLFRGSSALISIWTQSLIADIMTKFVRHASLISSLSEAGKLKLASDLAQFELALAPLQSSAGCRIADAGHAYRMLRAFRPLLFIDLAHIGGAACPIGPQHNLSELVVIHHLFSRSDASDLSQPYTLSGMDPPTYAHWMERNSEIVCLERVKESLDAYLQKSTARGDKLFASVYPVMCRLVDTARNRTNIL